MTVDEINAAMVALMDGANGRDLTDEEIAQYEQHERDLQAAQRTEQIRARHAGYQTVAPPIHPGSAGTTDEAGLNKAFNSFLRTGKANADISQLVAAQSEGVGAEGGYLVPEGFRTKLVERMKAYGGVAAEAEQFVTSTGNTVPWPTVDDTSNVGEIVDEGGVWSSGADVTFGSASLGAYTYAAGGGSSNPIRVSLELAQDAAFDLEGLVARLLGKRIGRVQATHVVSGDGVKKPKGLVHGKTGIELAANTEVEYGDLLKFIHAVDPDYRRMGNCKWAFNDNSLKTVQDLRDSNGDPLWRNGSGNWGQGSELESGRLLGYPVVVDQAFPDIVLNSQTVNWGAFGDFREGYVVRRVRDVVIVVNPWTRASNRQIEYSAWARMDAVPQDANAYVALTGFVA